MFETIIIDEYKKLHPEQWLKVYGVFSNRCDYINTCQVYQLEAVLGSIQRGWWDEYVLELVDEKEQPISVEEAFERCRQLENSVTRC